jgi:hypothetical protein
MCSFCEKHKEDKFMPIKKTRLNRKERASFLLRAQELEAAGIMCEIPNEMRENSHDLDIFVAEPPGNILCELPSGVTAYAIWVRLTALRNNLMLDDCQIVSEWDTESITLCPDQKGLYVVDQAVRFTQGEALNPKIENGLHFRNRGDVAHGWVVASGLKPIPDKYRDRMKTKLVITFTDQFGHPYSAQGEALLQRSCISKNSSPRVRTSLGHIGHRENELRYRETASNRSEGRSQEFGRS